MASVNSAAAGVPACRASSPAPHPSPTQLFSPPPVLSLSDHRGRCGQHHCAAARCHLSAGRCGPAGRSHRGAWLGRRLWHPFFRPERNLVSVWLCGRMIAPEEMERGCTASKQQHTRSRQSAAVCLPPCHPPASPDSPADSPADSPTTALMPEGTLRMQRDMDGWPKRSQQTAFLCRQTRAASKPQI